MKLKILSTIMSISILILFILISVDFAQHDTAIAKFSVEEEQLLIENGVKYLLLDDVKVEIPKKLEEMIKVDENYTYEVRYRYNKDTPEKAILQSVHMRFSEKALTRYNK